MVADKAGIRIRALQRREVLTPFVRRESGRLIMNKVRSMAAFQEARFVMAYCSFGSEIDTMPLLRAIARSRKSLVLPKVNRALARLETFKVEDIDASLVIGAWGIREPNAELCVPVALEEIELVLVPGAAFDRQGGRIGYGKGYYDRLLAACSLAGRHPRTVAAAFETQVVDFAPMESHDVHIDTLVTESGVCKCAP
jgi:5-formyltetrahydrofolate cyclo-ligase